MKIIIQGHGMVGSTLHAGLNKLGHDDIAIHDPWINEKWRVTPNSQTMADADVLFYCVNDKDGRVSDGTLIEKMVGKLVIIKTTVEVGETEQLQSMFPGVKIVFMPEFLREDTALYDFMHPDHIVYGSVDDDYSHYADSLLFTRLEGPRFFVEPKEAELIKLVSNVYPLIKLVFFNQLYDLCEKREIDYSRVIAPQRANKFNSGKYMTIYNKGGRGGGGKCLPKDLDILLQSDIARGLLREVKKANDKLLADCPKKR